MYFQNIQSVLIEGGAQLHQSFIDADLWDEIHIEESPQSILKGVSAAQIPTHTKYQRVKKMGRYILLYLPFILNSFIFFSNIFKLCDN